jgi:hypothetical protein
MNVSLPKNQSARSQPRRFSEALEHAGPDGVSTIEARGKLDGNICLNTMVKKWGARK